MAGSFGLGIVYPPLYQGDFSITGCLLNRDAGELDSVVLSPGLQVSPGVSKSTGKSLLSGDALHPVIGVDVLGENNLVARGAALAGNDGGVGKEELPDLATYQD